MGVAAPASLSASGAAAADLRAPSAEIARVRAERRARQQAEERLKKRLAELYPKLDDAARDEQLKEAKVTEVRYGSDGSVELKLILSLVSVDAQKGRK